MKSKGKHNYCPKSKGSDGVDVNWKSNIIGHEKAIHAR